MARRVYIVGAGASAPPPAGLPMFRDLLESLIASLNLTDEVADQAKQLAPETFMRAVAEGRLPLTEWLSRLLGAGEPNAVHHALAGAFRSGATIWTVNIDEHIEHVLGDDLGPVAAYPDSSPATTARILKPHGTLSVGEFVFRSDQVVRPLPSAWSERLATDLADAHVVLLGYRGADVDLRFPLAAALRKARTVTWYMTEEAEETTIQRFPVLEQFPHWRVGGEKPEELSGLFLDDAERDGLLAEVSPELRRQADEQTVPVVTPIRGNPVLARALIEERCGRRSDARRDYRQALRTLSRRQVTRAAEGMARIDLYTPTRLALFAYRWADSPYARLLPRSARLRLDRAHVTFLSSHEGRHDDAVRRAEKALDRADSAVLIARAKAERYRGDMVAAVKHASEVRRQAQSAGDDEGSPDDLAHALFELAFVDTWTGRFARARAILTELAEGIDQLAGVRWIAWAKWQLGCLDVYANSPDDALKRLTEAQQLFKQDGMAAGEFAALSVRLTALRVCDDHTFTDQRAELDAFRNKPGWTEYTDASNHHEDGEWARAHADLPGARKHLETLYAASGNEPIHRVIACLSLAELARQENIDSTALRREAAEVSRRHGFAYAAAHTAIADFLAGDLSEDETMQSIAASGAELVTRTGAQAATPSDYCIGARPELHEIFFP